jgi:NADH:ubiquinone oxidoreductase subunit C
MSDALAAALASVPGVARQNAADGIENVRVEPAQWLLLAEVARQAGYTRFLDLTVVDDPALPARFDVLITLYSFADKRWLRLRARTSGALASVMPVFPAADWFEREAWDLFGVRFEGHPNLVRILLPDDYTSHPLRADHPLGDEPVDFTVTREVDSPW